jgi:Triose-phosphate Transporter family
MSTPWLAGARIGPRAQSSLYPQLLQGTAPFFTALFSAVFLEQYLPLPVYLFLVPVVVGVSLASLEEVSPCQKSKYFRSRLRSNTFDWSLVSLPHMYSI